SLDQTLQHYWSFYVATSLGWDAAGALANAAIILAVGRPLMRTLRRYAHRLDPVATLEDPGDPEESENPEMAYVSHRIGG
ncbi:MAG: hypothetical protein ACR2MB_16120, partial [Acidimicrobiales bacterium]